MKQINDLKLVWLYDKRKNLSLDQMEIQTILVLLVFVLAAFYLIRSVVLGLKAKKGCGSSCKCGVDFSDTELKKG